jgi:RHS repeat-associated protein/uncharacterized repeat protein (TIGR01451 family)
LVPVRSARPLDFSAPSGFFSQFGAAVPFNSVAMPQAETLTTVADLSPGVPELLPTTAAALPQQASSPQSSQNGLAISVGFADSTNASANFPVPWKGAPNVSFVGLTGSSVRAGAIRLDNTTGSPITVDKVVVDLQRSSAVFNLWETFTVAANSSVILTQTAAGNFNTSAFPLVNCGMLLDPNESRIPRIAVIIAGSSTDYLDTAHVLDTGGFDLSCRGNESLQWRPVGTTGIEAPAGQIILSPDGTITEVGGTLAMTAQVNDAAGQPLPNALVTFKVLSGPEAGMSATAVSDVQGRAVFSYSGASAGTDMVQATLTNASGGTLLSNQVTANWSSAGACPISPNPPPGKTTLVYLGQTSAEFGETLHLAALLSDANGNALASQTLAFSYKGQSKTATTDNNGVAQTTTAAGAVGTSPVTVSFAGNAGNQPAQSSANITIAPEDTQVRYTGSTLLGTGTAQTVSATLSDDRQNPIANKSLTFQVGTATATATTNAQGSAVASLTLPASAASAPGQLQISFAGDTSYKASSVSVPVDIFLGAQFVIWGGNKGGLKLGQDVNFWGAQWSKQVTGGNYQANASFKGFTNTVNTLQLCEVSAGTGGALDDQCWNTKPGNSMPPATLPTYIEVIVSNAIAKNGSEIYGNIAAEAVCKVDSTPQYHNDPGHPGFCHLVAIVTDGAGIFPKPAMVSANQSQPAAVLPGQKYTVNTVILNSSTCTEADNVVLNETFDGVTPPTASTAACTIAPGGHKSYSFQETVPTVPVRQSNETSVDYESRLANLDGRLFTSTGVITFTDPANQPYLPVNVTSSSQLQMPRLTVAVNGSSCGGEAGRISYQVKITNIGSATATSGTLLFTTPDLAVTTTPIPSLGPGTSFTATINFTLAAIAPKGANETTAQYLARLAAIDGTQLNALARVNWTDALSTSYGTIEQPFVSTIERLPILSLVPQLPASVIPGQHAAFNFTVQNTGGGNAIQTDLVVTNPDNTTAAVPPFSLNAGQSTQVQTHWTVPAVQNKQNGETDSAYLARLQAFDNSQQKVSFALDWTDAAGNKFGPTTDQGTTTEQLPIVTISLSAPANANAGDTITYTANLQNTGHAAASGATVQITLPDNSTQSSVVSTPIAAGASQQVTFSYKIPTTQPAGTITATASVTWKDASNDGYGPLSSLASTLVTQSIVVNAGPDQTGLPTPNHYPLQGSVTVAGNPPGPDIAISWSQVSGPSQAVFADSHSPTSVVTLNSVGTYVLRLTAGSATTTPQSSDVHLTTIQGNLPPIVNAGPNQTIELPLNTVTLNGSATDPQNSPMTFAWTEVSGPGTATFSNPTALGTNSTFSASGVYILRLTATDALKLSGSADVRITVQPHNSPPVVNAGPDQTIFLPVNTTNLQGTATDDGLPLGSTLVTSWFVVSGPGIVTFVNPASPTSSASFSAVGNYVLRLSATDSEFTVTSDVAITVRPANQPPIVNAGPDQTIILPSNANNLPIVPTLISITKGFLNGVGIDYHQPTNDLVMSVNYPSGAGHNFELVGSDGTRTQFSSIAGLTDEVYIATARDEGNGISQGGFVAGEMLTGSGVPGVIVRISPDGTKVQNPWVTLPGEGGLLRGQLYIDRTGIFGGDLIVATTTGNIWRVNSSGVPTFLANLGVSTVEGLLTVPDDPLRYGPWAGKIIAGSENLPRVFAIDPQGNVTSYDLGIAPEHIKPVNANENYFGVDFSAQTLWGLPASELSGMVGDILIAEEFPGNLWQVHWNGSQFETTRIAQVPQFEGGTVAPAGIAQVTSTNATVTLNGTVTDDGLPLGGKLTSLWTKVSGPGTVTFSSPTTPVTSATFGQPGTYVLRLTGNDSELSASSDVTITIQANQAPVVDPGPEKQVTFPAAATLQGSVTDDGLPVGKLYSFWTKVLGPGRVTFAAPGYDPAADFSATSNPNGVWTYGWSPTRGGPFTADTVNQQTPIPAWFRGTGQAPPLIGYNNTGATYQTGSPMIPAGAIFMHPSSVGENAVLRWTAPNAGTFLVQGRFFAADTNGTTTDVAVLLNSSTTVLNGNVNGPEILPGLGAGVPFSFVKTLNAGDILDFTVGFGTDGNFGSDSTGLSVVITPSSDPATTASFSLPGDYDLRLAGFDTELFSFKDLHVSVLPTCILAPAGLVGWWPGDGSTQDLAAGNNGTIEGSGLTFAPGKIGQSFNFTGSDGDAVVPPSPAYKNSSFTLDAWVYPTDSSTLHPILEFNGGGANGANGPFGVHLWINFNSSQQISQGSLYANLVDTSGGFHIIGTVRGVMEPRQWTHVALTYDQSSGQARLYANGAAVAVANLGVFTPQNSFPFYIGARPGSQFRFPGQIDEVGMFNRALSADEINARFAAGSAGQCKPTLLVDAGPNQTVNLAQIAALNGSVTNDDGTPVASNVTISWKMLTGPGSIIFRDPSSPVTQAAFSATGQYVLQLSANDGRFTVASNTTVTVNSTTPGANQPPVVNAGPNQTITLPQNSLTLNGTVSDDGLPVGMLTQFWTVISGSGTVTFADNTAAVTTATFSAAGTYILRLTASDTQLSTSSDVTIQVLRAGSGTPGGLFLTGHDPDFHAFQGGNTVGAQHILQRAVNYVTFGKTQPKLLLVTSLVSTRGGTSDPRLGLNAAGFSGYDVADDGTSGVAGVLDLHAVNFSNYDVIIVASDFGGWLLQPELDILNARSAELIDFTNAGGGIVALAEGSAQAGTTHDRFGFLPFIVTEQSLDQNENGDTVTAAGLVLGLTNADINGNASHNIFRTSGGLDIIDNDASGNIVTLAERGRDVGKRGTINQPPVVNAGPDQAITLPTSTVTLNGTATDDGLPTGSTLTVGWAEISGPAPVTFGTPAQAVTQASFTTAGTYVLRLIASDSQLFSTADVHVTVNPGPGNQPPVVSAGPNQNITLPASATLNGSVTDDGLPVGGTLTSVWTQAAGPGTVTFSSPTTPVTQATFSAPGTYVLQLSASDSQLTSSAVTTVIVNANPAAPVVNAGPNQTITLPVNQVTLNGSATSPGGLPLTISWTEVSGPAVVTFANPASSVTTATFTATGAYDLRLTASDGQHSSTSDVTITVKAGIQSPVVSAGPGQTLTLPVNQVTLNGSASDPAGSQLTISWIEVSGPGVVIFANPASPVTTATFSAAGGYILRLSASNQQFTSTSDVVITVNAGINQAPKVSAGPNQTIQLPTNTVTLNGSVTDDGLPVGAAVTQQWVELTGPAPVTFSAPTQPVTQASFTTAGTHVLQLSASDTQLVSSATVTITVQPAQAQAPQVTISPVPTVTLPNTASLNATVAAPGLPSGATLTVQWTLTSVTPGPGAVTFANSGSINTAASFSAPGTYILRLTASDTLQTGFDEVSVQVQPPATPPPVVSITSPSDDADVTSPTPVIGNVSNGNWKLEYAPMGANGPSAFVPFASGSGAVTNGTLGTFDPTVLLNGQYAIRITSTDDAGQIGFFTVQVGVSRNLKVGIFTLSFNDLSVALPGLPITVTRTYDSRDKHVGDFGVGWTLRIANVRVQKNGPIGQLWDEEVSWSGFTDQYCLEPAKNHTVTLTFADERVYKFHAVSTPECQLFAPITAPQIAFVQVPTDASTAGATLTPIGDTNLIVDGSIPGPQNIVDFNGNFIDYTQFRLTTAEGFIYIIDQTLGVTSLTDINGNTLTINANGIISSAGKSVAFTRDAQNRIAQITDPNGASLNYVYNANGDLVTFTDRSNNTSTYTYNNNHDLLTIQDPRNIQPVRNDFDASGRLLDTIDAFGKQINYQPNLSANNELITDRLGHSTLYEYDSKGNITRLTDALGNSTQYTYDSLGNRLTETNALNKTTKYTYDSVGNLLSVTDALGHQTSYTYNPRKQVLTITDALNHVTTNVYDGNGNLTSTTDALNNVTGAVYNLAGQPISVKDAQGNVSTLVYDSNGRLIKLTDALSNITTYTYDNNGNKLTQSVTRTRADGTTEALTTQYQYDASNRLIKTTNPDGSSTQTHYNAIGKQDLTTDALGRQTGYTYDDMSRLIKVTYPDGTSESNAYDAENHRLTSTDRIGHTSTYGYDVVGRLTKTTYADGSSMQMVYDIAGRLIQSIDPLNHTTQYGYDDAGRQTSQTDALNNTTTLGYDVNDNQISIKDANGNLSQYLYDADNRRLGTTYPDGSTDSTSYDALGRVVSKRDQAGKVTQYGYDPLGRLVSVRNALSQVTQYVYDEVGNRIAQTDASNHTTKYMYDQLGRRIKRTLPAGQAETYSYDAAGNLKSKTDFNGKSTTYSYDAMNRLLSKSPDVSFNAQPVSFTYNALGQRLNMTDPSGTTSYAYDNRNRLLAKTTPFGALSYSYDGASNLLTLKSSNTNGVSETYSYDALNRVSTVTDGSGASMYTYDNVGNVQSLAYPNGIATGYHYDPLNRLTQMGAAEGGTPLSSYTYSLGPTGNRLSVSELSGRNVNYGYDDLYRLTSETISGAASNNGTVSYVYDAVGNRKQMASTVAAIPAGVFNYDNNDRLATDNYDDDGNTISSGGIGNHYDFESHMIQHGNVAIVYDGDGNRVSETVGGVTTNYLVDTQNLTGYAQVVEELRAGAVVRRYSWGLGLISKFETGSSSLSFYGYDGHGSVRQLFNSAGVVTDTYDFDAFGNLINSSGSTPNNYLFAGEQFDPALSLYYNRGRYLNPATGRFWGMDTSEGDDHDPRSLHTYTYAMNNPVNRIDPSGHDSFLSNGAIGLQAEVFLWSQYPETCWNSRIADLVNGVCSDDYYPFARKPDFANVDYGDVFDVKPSRDWQSGITQVQDYVSELKAGTKKRIDWHVGTREDFTPFIPVMPLLPGTPGVVAGFLFFPPPSRGVLRYYVIDTGDAVGEIAVAYLLAAGLLESAGDAAAGGAAAEPAAAAAGKLLRMPGGAAAAEEGELEMEEGEAELELVA